MGLKEAVVLRVAKRWISGVDLDSAIKDARKANARGMGVVVNYLGEDISDPQIADAHTQEYLKLQQAMADSSIRGFVSVKLTQLGLFLDQSETSRRLELIASNAERLGQRLWLDMESSRSTDKTLAVYKEARQRHQDIGIALQAYLHRSEADLNSIIEMGGKVRLVKGAYREPHDLVFATRYEIRENFARLMKMLFDKSEGFAIGTHDSFLIGEAKRLSDSSHTNFEFELLKGIRDELKLELAKSGYNVSEYLPYGDRWFDYSRRRMTEHPSNIWLLLRSLV